MQSSLPNIMMQLSTYNATKNNGLHVAIIMDGNGRWAAARGLPRTQGHRAGAEAVRRTIEAAPECGITTLTLYAFSVDNWQRPQPEVSALMNLLRVYLLKETRNCLQRGIRISFIGRRDRLPRAVRMAMEASELMTRNGTRLHLRVAVDYSARDAILAAAQRLQNSNINRDSFGELLTPHAAAPDVDLVIRTSGEQRLSDFLLWESAYAELYFTKVFWPDFERADLLAALEEFHFRDRRFGSIQTALAG